MDDFFSECRFIDIHYHASPDLYIRRFNALEAGERYLAEKGVVVLKSHLGSTGSQAMLAQQRNLPVLPSLVLNSIAGGIDYRVILRALAEYQSEIAMNMIVHFPTLTGRSYQSKLKRKLTHPHLKKYTLAAETVFNEQNKLKKEVIDVLKLANDYPVVLSTGHASKQEVYALIEACDRYQVQALLLNQPANPLTGLNAQELHFISRYSFVWIEQTALTFLLGHQSKDDIREVLTSLPRVIYSSDLGQASQMNIHEWVGFSQKLFQEFALSPEQRDKLCRINPLQLLSIR
ncbi:DUF6282 family protein [Legionella londiniensis]|uniref:Amidohydrolase n=1 Tax=Legionella londiniensis TaxID=45068 RepID=A0A0W0VPC3_9GAMM|nr:DUF6282 family protein [Legionella londiniensis]KTD21972.1 hypothetical protein Llon_0704 [Legionella londiniensis]STX94014.1 Uncharacterised protein [Legionella londiniensis]